MTMSEETELAEDSPNEEDPTEKDDEKSKDEDSMGTRVGFVFSMVITGIFLVASLVLVLFWVLRYRNGFGWQDEPQKEFNFHPTLMVAGFIFFSGFSMLFYRMMTCCRKIVVKLLHTVFHALAIACIAVGFLTVWDSHELVNPKIPNFYSLHSWLGLTTMGLFAIQFVVGFFSFLVLLCCEGRTAACRAALVPTHATFGIITFVMACATAVTGLTEKVLFTLGDEYGQTQHFNEVTILNTLGVTIIAAMICMVWFLRTRPIKRDSAVISERL